MEDSIEMERMEQRITQKWTAAMGNIKEMAKDRFVGKNN